MIKISMIYLLIVNIIGFIIMGWDKRKAKRGHWRIPEKKFFVLALLGGWLGIYLGMKVFRHKTLHLSFRLGIPVLGIINIALVYSLWHLYLYFQ